MEKLLISACLLGISSRYDGKSKRAIDDSTVKALSERYELVPFCPEIYGGLSTPRIPAERVGDEYFNKDGVCVTENYIRGAKEALALSKLLGIKKALLKARSPSCGKGRIYDGSFSGTLTDGNGAAAELLMRDGIEVFTEEEIDKLF